MLFPSESLIQYSSASRYLLIISHNTEVSKSFPVIENYLHHDFHNFHQISLHHPSIHDFAPSVQSMNCPFFLTDYQPGTAKWLNPEPIQLVSYNIPADGCHHLCDLHALFSVLLIRLLQFRTQSQVFQT